MTRHRRLLLSVAFCVLLLGGAASARGADEKESNSSGEGITKVFKWINFAIVAGGLVYLCVKRGPAFFRGRAEKIGAAIAQAAAVKAEADRQLQDAQTRLRGIDQEVGSLRIAAGRDAAAEAERVRAITRVEIEKVHFAASAEIEAAERAARLELKVLAAKLAVDGAESLLAKQLTPKAQEALVNAFVLNLAGRPN
jgi:F-type H+-transporting ATPase subunit b